MDTSRKERIAFVTGHLLLNYSNCQCGFYILEYKLIVNVHLKHNKSCQETFIYSVLKKITVAGHKKITKT
jgi:hypothetical protein